MALYETPSLKHLPTLFHVGFAARLRCEIADIFIGVDGESKSTPKTPLSIVSKREEALLFQFASTSSSTVNDNVQTPIVAHIPGGGEPPTPVYMALGETPQMGADPSLLRMSLERSPRTNRLLFSISTVGPSSTRRYLSLHQRKSLQTVETCSKFEMFHLEILAESIGRAFSVAGEWNKNMSYIYPAQALIYAILQSGTRFQLQSAAHSTFIAQTPKKKNVCLYDRQDEQLVEQVITFNAIPVEKQCLNGGLQYTLRSAEDNHVLSILPSGKIAMKADVSPPVCVRVDSRYWDAIHIGAAASEGNERHTNWLMANQNGKVETRRHFRHYETFRLHLVVQSLRAQLEQLAQTVSPLVARAEQSTRATVRAQIEQACNSTTSGSEERPASTSSTFNHAAALRGLLSIEEQPSTTTSTATENQPTSTPKPKSKRKRNKNRPPQIQQSAGSQASPSNSLTATATAATTATAAAAVATSALPRHAANRKAAKRNRKKKKKGNNSSSSSSANNNSNRNLTNSSQRNSSSSNVNSVPSSSSSTPSSSSSSPTTEDSSTTDTPSSSTSSSQPSSSSSSEVTTPAATGPPCAACGRPIPGPQVTAMGRTFHPSCLVCGRCRRPVTGGKFRQSNNVPYCEGCYASHVASRCARCEKPILGTVTTAMDKTWHHECLTCSICRLPLTQTFWIYANKPNEPRCARCVTGDEHATSRHHGQNQRLVNLPGFGGMNKSSAEQAGGMALGDVGGIGGVGGGATSSATGPGRARMMSMPAPSPSSSTFSTFPIAK